MTTIHRIATTGLLVLSLAATGAPAASARPVDYQLPSGVQAPARAYDRPDREMIPVPRPSRGDVAPATVLQAAVQSPSLKSGFDWGDAGIGAAGGIGIAMLATCGGMVAVRVRRDHLDPAAR